MSQSRWHNRVDGRVKPGMTMCWGIQVIENPKKDEKESRLSEAEKPATLKLRPIGLHKGKVRISDNFDDPLPDEFMKAFE